MAWIRDRGHLPVPAPVPVLTKQGRKKAQGTPELSPSVEAWLVA